MVSTSLAPAVIAGVVALLSASLSAAVALYTIRRASVDRLDMRSQEFAMQLLPKRLDAYERLWGALIVIEQEGAVEPSIADDLVRSSIWLPQRLRNDLLSLLLSDTVDHEQVRNVRARLLSDAAIDRIEAATARLATAEGA